MQLKLSTPFYIGAFVVLLILIFVLLVISPTQNSFFELKEIYPILYYNLHENKYAYNIIIKEIVDATGITRIDMDEILAVIDPLADNSNLAASTTESPELKSTKVQLLEDDQPVKIESPKLEWISYSSDKYDYIRGKVDILPLYYNNRIYDNAKYFSHLMRFLKVQPNVINIYFWRLAAESALLQHTPKCPDGKTNIHEESILDKNILRYTLAVNVLSCAEEDCSIWVGGHLKKLVFDKYVLWDPSKEFSLHNDSATEGDVLFLNIDILRD